MPKRKPVEKGEKFGRWTVIEASVSQKVVYFYARVQCGCGERRDVREANLRGGGSKSCGCLKRELTKNRNTTHSGSGTRLHQIWKSMKQRCYNPTNACYHRYGGRGITICKVWRDSFAKFREWSLDNGYQDDLTIDRIKNEKGYCPSNCRWATYHQQRCNIRPYGKSGFKGVTQAKSGNWEARIWINGTLIHLGTYDKATKAAQSYNESALEYFGEFA